MHPGVSRGALCTGRRQGYFRTTACSGRLRQYKPRPGRRRGYPGLTIPTNDETDVMDARTNRLSLSTTGRGQPETRAMRIEATARGPHNPNSVLTLHPARPEPRAAPGLAVQMKGTRTLGDGLMLNDRGHRHQRTRRAAQSPEPPAGARTPTEHGGARSGPGQRAATRSPAVLAGGSRGARRARPGTCDRPTLDAPATGATIGKEHGTSRAPGCQAAPREDGCRPPPVSIAQEAAGGSERATVVDAPTYAPRRR